MTRDEVQLEYLAAIDGANTGKQALAFQTLCDSLVHIGWMQGFADHREMVRTEMKRGKPVPALHPAG